MRHSDIAIQLVWWKTWKQQVFLLNTCNVICTHTHQKKTCEMITPHGVIRQFPANGRLITPTMSWSHHLCFDHTVKFLITPLNVWSHRHIFDHTLKFLITPYTFCSHRKDFDHTVKKFDHTVKLFDHTVYILFTPFGLCSHHQFFCSLAFLSGNFSTYRIKSRRHGRQRN